MVKVNYEQSYKHNFGRDVRKATEFFINMDSDGIGFVLHPQALNPFLKIIETMGDSKLVGIFPAFDNADYDKINEPMYLILKLKEEGVVGISFDVTAFTDTFVKTLKDSVNNSPMYFPKTKEDVSSLPNNCVFIDPFDVFTNDFQDDLYDVIKKNILMGVESIKIDCGKAKRRIGKTTVMMKLSHDMKIPLLVPADIKPELEYRSKKLGINPELFAWSKECDKRPLGRSFFDEGTVGGDSSIGYIP